MIRQSIEPGTKVWHADFGFGIFEKYRTETGAVVKFENYTLILNRKHLTEVEDI